MYLESALKINDTITSLHLWNNQITDVGAYFLKDIL